MYREKHIFLISNQIVLLKFIGRLVKKMPIFSYFIICSETLSSQYLVSTLILYWNIWINMPILVQIKIWIFMPKRIHFLLKENMDINFNAHYVRRVVLLKMNNVKSKMSDKKYSLQHNFKALKFIALILIWDFRFLTIKQEN